MRITRAVVLFSILLAASACGDDTVTPTDPTPTRPSVTETFTGVVTVNGASIHSFSSGSGQISVTLTALSPDTAAIVGVSLGTWNGTACSVVIDNNNATQAAVVIGSATTTGSFCARVYDPGRLEAATEYTLTVVHF